MRHRIKLRPAEVKDFVAAASKCEFDVDIAYNTQTSHIDFSYAP